MQKHKVINSALWAAYGDALGFIAELADESRLQYRLNGSDFGHLKEWKRKIGGFNGILMDIPAGTYSDDTQLRLAVSRCIGANGIFALDAFAKIELPVWRNYALGGGIGTHAAADNLVKASTSWFNNFFSVAKTNYCSSGGNGAAMRIQPHVWASQTFSPDEFITNVLANAIVTHGHARGILGAAFHSLCLAHALANKTPPSIDSLRSFTDFLRNSFGLFSEISEIGRFWLSAWEKKCGYPFKKQYISVIDEIVNDINVFASVYKRQTSPEKAYKELALKIDALGSKQIGSGTKTTLLATASALLFEKEETEKCLKYICGVLETDTDTIGSMAGAIIGSYSDQIPSKTLQDFEYIAEEAERLCSSSNSAASIFAYPELMKWRVPKSGVDAVVVQGDRYFLQGLGELTFTSGKWEQDSYFLCWAKLPFNQTVLVKARNTQLKRNSTIAIGEYRSINISNQTSSDKVNAQLCLLEQNQSMEKLRFVRKEIGEIQPEPRRLQRYQMYILIENMIREAAHSGFSPLIMGNHMAKLLERADADASLPLYATLLRRARYKIRD